MLQIQVFLQSLSKIYSVFLLKQDAKKWVSYFICPPVHKSTNLLDWKIILENQGHN